MKNLALFLVFCTTSTLFSARTHAHNLVDGGSEEVAQQNKETLRSVIYMIYEAPSKKSCSASVVGPNTLLTAAHCVKDLKLVAKVTLNNVENFTIQKINAILPDLPVSDLAFIKVAPPNTLPPGGRTFLDETPYLEIASPSQAAKLSPYLNQVLISGYGLQNIKDIQTRNNTVGTLRAGFATAMSAERKQQFKLSDAEIVFTGIRTSRTTIKSIKGEKFNGNNLQYSRRYTVQGSLGLPGDSGSPAIVFDENHKPWIIGVASKFGAFTKPTVAVSVQEDGDTVETKIAFNPKLGVSTYVDQYLVELKRLKLVSKRDINKTNYSILIDSSGEYVNDYTSTMDESNQRFIQSSMKEFL